VWTHFTNVEESILLLSNYKKELMEKMKAANADISTVTLEFLEGGTDRAITVHDPEPYIIAWDR
jgi:hypothetical protein